MSDNKENGPLFADFQAVTVEEWREKLSRDLKGLPYEKLIWKTNEGIEVKPFYTSEDLNNLVHLHAGPYEQTFAGKENKLSGSWEIRQDITIDSVENANAAAIQALNLGATSIGFVIPEDKILSQDEFSLLLNGIFFDCININFLNQTNSNPIPELLAAECKSKNVDPLKIFGSVDNDPLGYLTKNGRFENSEEKDLKLTASSIKSASALFPKLRTLGINGHIFHNAGGNIVQELGFSLAIISDYLDLLGKEGIKPETIAKSMQLNLAVGPVYFMEIAKIRAARLLFARLVRSWEADSEDALKIFIHCNTSDWNQTIYDPYVNMLRSTTESMSAALGGCDSLTVSPFDKAFRSTTKFSERIARNTQVILKEEAWFDKVQDPAAGSYLIESLTDSVITESWKLFLEIEEMGGYIAAFKAGEIQKRIANSAALKNQNIAQRKEILLGTNQFPNPLEHKPEDLVTKIAFPRNDVKKNSIAEPLKLFRGAEDFEKLRIKSETQNHKVFLLTIGNPVWRKARAGFAANFFGCAGFEIIDNPGFDTLEEGISAAFKSKASIVVLCSSDEEYATLAPEAITKLDKKTLFVVAGFPKDSIEELKSKGVQNFIHVKSDVLEELVKYQEMLSVRIK
jgi:methylmalonyl-CoA mutase